MIIYTIKQEELHQDKVNSSLVCTRNCTMDYSKKGYSPLARLP